MKPIIQFSIALLAVLTLSACGIQNKPNNSQESNQKQERASATSTESTNDLAASDEPFFTPLFSEFHMGKLSKETINFPVVSNKIESVRVKVYKVSKESFVALQNQHTGWVNHEAKLDTAKLSAKEKKPFFEGQVKIHETGKATKILRESALSGPPGEKSEMNGYIEIPMVQANYTVFNQGYYYFEFKAPEVLKYTGGDEFNALLEITETRASINYEEQYVN